MCDRKHAIPTLNKTFAIFINFHLSYVQLVYIYKIYEKLFYIHENTY